MSSVSFVYNFAISVCFVFKSYISLYVKNSKGSATDVSYFLKQEIAKNITHYIDKLQELNPEDVDLTHNNKNNKFYKRKKQFVKEQGMKVFNLTLNGIEYTIKMGEFMNGKGYHLYTILGLKKI